jgi:hypothetical protein
MEQEWELEPSQRLAPERVLPPELAAEEECLWPALGYLLEQA